MENEQSLFQNASNLFKTLAKQYSFTEYDTTGKSLLGRDLPLLHVGTGNKVILMIGGADAGDRISEPLLLQFCADLCTQIERQSTVYGLNCAFVAHSRRILVLPCLNPDGKALTAEGADPSSPLYERQLRQNGMKSDFSAWQGNARGVHPDLNFNEDFAKRRSQLMADGTCTVPATGEFPESEPETAFAARLVRALCPALVLECGRSLTDTIYTNRPEETRRISQHTDCSITSEFVYGIPSWFSRTYGQAAIHLTLRPCHHGENRLYCRFREFLFRTLYTIAV